MANRKMVALLSLLFVGTGHALPEKRRVNLAPTPARIQGALGCLATVLAGMDDNDFKVFGLARHEFRPGKVVQARVHVHKQYWGLGRETSLANATSDETKPILFRLL